MYVFSVEQTSSHGPSPVERSRHEITLPGEDRRKYKTLNRHSSKQRVTDIAHFSRTSVQVNAVVERFSFRLYLGLLNVYSRHQLALFVKQDSTFRNSFQTDTARWFSGALFSRAL